MSLEALQRMLLWCAVMNYAVLSLWFFVFISAREWLQGLHARWFHLTAGQFDALHYGGMAVYKIGVLLFNIVPYLALRIVA